MRERGPRAIAATLLAVCVFATAPAHAQAGLGHLEDATVVPRGLFRLRAITAWTRYDSRFTSDGIEPLGAPFTADSLGPVQLPTLAPIQTLVQSVSASPFTMSLGRSRLGAMGRQEVLPIGFEYGLTNRLTVGVTIPVVRTRIAAHFQLDSAGANVGANLHGSSAAARQANLAVQAQFADAAAQLQARLTFCTASTASPGCPELLAREPEAQALLLSSQAFALDVESLYGGVDANGQPFVPVAQSAAQAAIALRVSDFNSSYRDLLASGVDLISAVPAGAGGPAGTAQIQEYLHGQLGRDSLTMQERVGFGDVEFGVRALLLDRPATRERRAGAQVLLATGIRLPTGSRQSPSELMDLSLGSGGVTTDIRAVADLRFARAGLLTTGAFQVTQAEDGATRGDRHAFSVHLAPRWHLSEPLSVHAAYTHRDGDLAGAMQFVGGGVTLSTLSTFRRGGGPLPMEMRFTHLEAIGGEPGQPKYFRDQIELRIYFRGPR
ncbi:MAG: hypothetical protein WD801_04590 [Gemmatimonadaceae bacterium]